MKKRLINPKQIVEFMIVAGKLKWTKRSGWLREKMPEPETVAEHTFRVAILSLILAPILKLNRNKLVTMAIVHDLAQGVLGDPIFQRGRKVIEEHNYNDERKFCKTIFDNLNQPNLYKIWDENNLENSKYKTKYSDALYQIGKIATVWQAFEYEIRGVPVSKTKEFWENAEFHVKHPFLREILMSLKKARKKYKLI
jgi:5'-deoxynucleotidase YfbR-like HD superfamily hydrolase